MTITQNLCDLINRSIPRNVLTLYLITSKINISLKNVSSKGRVIQNFVFISKSTYVDTK